MKVTQIAMGQIHRAIYTTVETCGVYADRDYGSI